MDWRNVTPSLPPLTTPLLWASGGGLLALGMTLTGLIAVLRAVGRLFH